MALDQGADFHVADEFDVADPAVSQGRAEGVERFVPFAKLNSVHLHLFARLRFKPDYWIDRKRRSNAA